jgi:ribosomal protein S18 acetylase RimI-like enzyme
LSGLDSSTHWCRYDRISTILVDSISRLVPPIEPTDEEQIFSIQTHPVSPSELNQYALVRSSFQTDVFLDVVRNVNGFELNERRLDRPYRKDYDALDDPNTWSGLFNTSNWIVMSALVGETEQTRIGGAVGAFNTAGVDMLEGRSDLLVLWDIRVSSGAHRQGVGSTLLHSLEAWGRLRNCREIKVETQNTNIAACRFYARHGFRLGEANRGAYAELPNELQLIWRKDLNDWQ